MLLQSWRLLQLYWCEPAAWSLVAWHCARHSM